MNGLIIDSFAGGGGASTGIEKALGRPVDIAINHDKDAIRMHKANHPQTKHYCEDVWEVDPHEATNGQPVALMWLSPDCTHFSKARGCKPRDKKIRGLAWMAVKWAKAVRPAVIILENVEEFRTWGPLRRDGTPDKSKRGKTFDLFIANLRGLGYTAEFRELVASDYGAPTSRKRFFLVARCDGRPIVWPEPTHGNPDSLAVRCGLLAPWRSASEIIDWTIPCPSIFDRKKPLCEKTMQRIARGLQKFVLKPFIMQCYGGGYTASGRSVDKQLPTITAKDHNALVMPFVSQYHSYEDSARGQSLRSPLLTIDGSNRYALIAPYMMHYYTSGTGASIKSPIGTITADGQHLANVQVFLIKYYGQSHAQSLKAPLDTITAMDRFGLITIKGEPYQIVDIGMRMLTPRELFDAQGFPPDYIINRDAEGREYSKKAQVARVGNSVVPQMAEALVRANVLEKRATKEA